MLCANNQISSNIKINGVVFIPFVSIPSKTTWTYSHRFMPLRLTMQMRAEIWIPATDLIGLLLLCWTVQLSYWIYIIYLNGYHFVIFCHILSYFVIYVVVFCHILSYVMTPMNALFDTLKLKHFRKTNSSYIETKNWTNPFRVYWKIEPSSFHSSLASVSIACTESLRFNNLSMTLSASLVIRWNPWDKPT